MEMIEGKGYEWEEWELIVNKEKGTGGKEKGKEQGRKVKER